MDTAVGFVFTSDTMRGHSVARTLDSKATATRSHPRPPGSEFDIFSGKLNTGSRFRENHEILPFERVGRGVATGVCANFHPCGGR